ncbi:ParB N-terminal domain-containing protein [Budviciaceae bacterium BWR-B9]|uniref:ParB N-terminal domain-containing protein n=1 Tax=Limnobaculum allomyrinae TaxID=2791986 RepID=A0ABS1IW62_9GAMM|nr:MULTISPECIES: plasmid partitioning protein RepB C-terminal domain-containing protein [Limnobaculum]MBK5146017.1 ParB N-terminal domain-containing protein [Limnobaculum allomyrinae]MBV7694058.1 ParB N-terminal domain-containing protein [Limnobaculum sp. M2-1]
MKNKVSYCFDKTCIEVRVLHLLPTKNLPKNIKYSQKYKQVLSSISVVGLVEPIVIYPSKDNDGYFNILDGHLRIEAIKELNIPIVPCLIATFEDTFTYNKRVSRLNVIHEHNMIIKAVESGVSINKLSEALGISEDTIKGRFKLLDGICPEVISALSDKDVPRTIFTLIKKTQPIRQIEIVNSMISINNYTYKFVYSMLYSTPDSLLVKNNPKNNKLDKDRIETIRKLQNELAILDSQKKELEETYSENSLQLVIIKSHIDKLLSNIRIINWLYDNKPDHLSQLKYISNIKSL